MTLFNQNTETEEIQEDYLFLNPITNKLQVNKDAILSAVNQARQEVKDKENSFDEYCKQNDIVARFDFSYTYQKLICKKFPLITWFNISIVYGNGSDNLVKDIVNVYKYPEYHIMKNIHIQQFINGNKIKVSKNSVYYFNKFQAIDIEIIPKVIQEFKNGNVIVKLKPDEYKNFMKVYNWTNTHTEKIANILKNPHNLTSEQYEIIIKRAKEYRPGDVIHTIAEMFNLQTRFINYNTLTDLVKDLLNKQ